MVVDMEQDMEELLPLLNRQLIKPKLLITLSTPRLPRLLIRLKQRLRLRLPQQPSKPKRLQQQNRHRPLKSPRPLKLPRLQHLLNQHRPPKQPRPFKPPKQQKFRLFNKLKLWQLLLEPHSLMLLPLLQLCMPPKLNKHLKRTWHTKLRLMLNTWLPSNKLHQLILRLPSMRPIRRTRLHKELKLTPLADMVLMDRMLPFIAPSATCLPALVIRRLPTLTKHIFPRY